MPRQPAVSLAIQRKGRYTHSKDYALGDASLTEKAEAITIWGAKWRAELWKSFEADDLTVEDFLCSTYWT